MECEFKYEELRGLSSSYPFCDQSRSKQIPADVAQALVYNDGINVSKVLSR